MEIEESLVGSSRVYIPVDAPAPTSEVHAD